MSDYTKALGVGLRRARHKTGMSLQGMEDHTDGRYKASVLGAYERGERAITVERLHKLCWIYQVHVISVLPAIDPSRGF